MLEALKRNPDAVAIAVLSLTLGIAGRWTPGRVYFAAFPARPGVHQIWDSPARMMLDNVRDRLQEFSSCSRQRQECPPRLDF